jgi:predicted phosphodiesterase
MKWLRYQRVVSLETQVGITSQRNKWANTDPRIYRKWDQVPMRSKHPLSTGHTHRQPHFKVKNQKSKLMCPGNVNGTIRSQNQCVGSGEQKNPQIKISVQIWYIEQSIAKTRFTQTPSNTVGRIKCLEE